MQYVYCGLNNNISRDVQEECTNKLYIPYIHIAAIQIMENSGYLTVY